MQTVLACSVFFSYHSQDEELTFDKPDSGFQAT